MNEVDFANKIASLGGRAYIVGGWMRDICVIIHRKIKTI